MRTWPFRLACAAWIAVGAANAGDLAVTAFDATGRLTFREVASAESYRVEWSTDPVTGNWSSTAPGLALVPPTGAATQTVTVGLIKGACFYRVVATVTNGPAAGITSTFDLSAEGWLAVQFPFRTHRPEPATQPLPWDGAFGNPAGSVRIGDLYPETGIAAPAQFLGDKSAYYGGSLSYDVVVRFSDNVAYPELCLNSGTRTLYFDAPSPVVNAWEHRVVPLSEAGWKDAASGQPATAAMFREVLSHLVGLYLYTEWRTGPDDTSVDNVSLRKP